MLRFFIHTLLLPSPSSVGSITLDSEALLVAGGLTNYSPSAPPVQPLFGARGGSNATPVVQPGIVPGGFDGLAYAVDLIAAGTEICFRTAYHPVAFLYVATQSAFPPNFKTLVAVNN